MGSGVLAMPLAQEEKVELKAYTKVREKVTEALQSGKSLVCYAPRKSGKSVVATTLEGDLKSKCQILDVDYESKDSVGEMEELLRKAVRGTQVILFATPYTIQWAQTTLALGDLPSFERLPLIVNREEGERIAKKFAGSKLNDALEANGRKLLEKILEYSKPKFALKGDKGSHVTYAPGLILSKIEYLLKNREKWLEEKNLDESSKEACSILDERKRKEEKALEAFGIRMANAPAIVQEIFSGPVATFLTGSMSPVAVVLSAVPLISGLLNKIRKGSSRYSDLSEIAQTWRDMTEDERAVLCEKIDEEHNWEPGTAISSLRALFGEPNLVEKINRKIDERFLNNEKAILNRIRCALRNDEEFRGHVEQIVKQEFTSFIEALEERLSKLEEGQSKLEEGQKRIEEKLEEFQKEQEMEYVVLDAKEVAKNRSLLLDALNLRVTYNTGSEELEIPFVKPSFEPVDMGSFFIAGLSGSGKTRLLYELAAERCNKSGLGDIIILEPYHIAAGVYKKSGKCRVSEIGKVIGGSRKPALILLDNFPRGIPSDDASTDPLLNQLETLRSSGTADYIVTLNPEHYTLKDYPSVLGAGVHYVDLSNLGLEEKDYMRQLLIRLGRVYLTQYIYEVLEAQLNEVANSLADRWCSPLAVQIFLAQVPSSLPDVTTLAATLREQDYQNYIKELFSRMDPKRKHFLVSLMLSKILGSPDTLNDVSELQYEIFRDELDEPFRTLGSFIYQKNGRINVHDLYLESITLDRDTNHKVYIYINQNLKRVVKNSHSSDKLEFWKFLAKGLDYGISFDSIAQIINRGGSLWSEFGKGVGVCFGELSYGSRREAIELAEKTPGFAKGFGYGVGLFFHKLTDELKPEVFELAVSNPHFANEFGHGVGLSFDKLSDELRREVIGLAVSNLNFAWGIGSFVELFFEELSDELKREVIGLAMKSPSFAEVFGYGAAVSSNWLSDG